MIQTFCLLLFQNSGRALNEILFLVESHVTELNTIFGQTVFTTKVGDRALSYKGIQFEIRKVQVDNRSLYFVTI